MFKDGEKIGSVTSGSFCPTVGGNIGLAYVAACHATIDNEIEIEIRSKHVAAKIVKKPFYKRDSKS